MKNILRGLNILVFGNFQGILLVMKILKGYLFCVVGIMNPLFLTTRSVGLTTSSVAQVGSSGQECDPRISSISKDLNQSQQKWWTAEVKIVTLALWKERIQYLPAEIRNYTITTLGRSQNMCYKTV